MATSGTTHPLASIYDVALLDLDGVIYVGPYAIPHAVEAVAEARVRGMRIAFVTNNASRTPQTVASHLESLGIPARPEEVVTSSMAAARMMAETLPAGAAVLVIGGEGLVEALRERGLRPVFSADDAPAAMVQGYDPDLSWRQLAEGAYALQSGVPWVAANQDLTLPTPRGQAPGNGAFVDLLRAITGREPSVAGKPEPPMHREGLIRTGARNPLVVGDRLDTDIEGANRVGADSLLVMTGVTDPVEAVLAPPERRPTYLAADLRGLLVAHPRVTSSEGAVRCGGWVARVDEGEVRLRRVASVRAESVRAESAGGGHSAAEAAANQGVGDDRTHAHAGEADIDALRALTAVVWASSDEPPPACAVAAAWEGRETGSQPPSLWRTLTPGRS